MTRYKGIKIIRIAENCFQVPNRQILGTLQHVIDTIEYYISNNYATIHNNTLTFRREKWA